MDWWTEFKLLLCFQTKYVVDNLASQDLIPFGYHQCNKLVANGRSVMWIFSFTAGLGNFVGTGKRNSSWNRTLDRSWLSGQYPDEPSLLKVMFYHFSTRSHESPFACSQVSDRWLGNYRLCSNSPSKWLYLIPHRGIVELTRRIQWFPLPVSALRRPEPRSR